MVWWGGVWCGVVGRGVVCGGVVGRGVVWWCGGEECGVVWWVGVWCGGVVRGVVWCDVMGRGVVWCDVVGRGVVWWCGAVVRGVVWGGVWCGVVVWCVGVGRGGGGRRRIQVLLSYTFLVHLQRCHVRTIQTCVSLGSLASTHHVHVSFRWGHAACSQPPHERLADYPPNSKHRLTASFLQPLP